MAGETTSEYGGTVLPRKIRSSLRGILGWDAYKQYSRGLPGLERRLLFNQYSGVCAHMAVSGSARPFPHADFSKA
jgi:hypothetical protein